MAASHPWAATRRRGPLPLPWRGRLIAPVLLLAAVGLLNPRPARAETWVPDNDPCAAQQSTLGISECLQGRTKLWDQRLNAAYADLLKRIDPAQRQPLQAAQRLWIRYRDANCQFYGAQQGTIREIEAAECLHSMTQDRAIELNRAMKFDQP